jgi:hypothetical protein
MTTIVQKFIVGDQQFDTKADALAYMRRPAIEGALKKVADGNMDLVKWLIENQEAIEVAFEVGTIQRVTNSERKKLEKALEALKEIQGNPKIAFLQENAGAIKDSFRWPSVKRMSEEEKTVAARNSLMAATDNNEKLVGWILANREAIMEGYEAGKEKREVNPKATEALAAYRAKKAAEKEAAEAAKGNQPAAA